MLKNQEICNFLTENLNNSGVVGQDYQFIIHSEVGKNENNNLIQGIMRVVKNDHLPIPGIRNNDFNAIVEFLTPANCSNKVLEKIEKIITSFKNNWNGKEYQFSQGKGLITFTSALTDYFKTEYGIGNTVPLRIGLNITYTENMVTSARKVWQIRTVGVANSQFLTIPFISESVYLEKGGKTNNISDALFQQTLLTSQIKYYRFEIPYETDDTLCSMLQKDILTGDFNKKYELKFYDGVSFTESNPFTTIVSIFRSGDSSSKRPNIANFNITFADVDDGNNAIKYQMALIDNPFDTLSENTQYFPNQTEQQAYYQTLIDIGADFDDIPAPNLNSLNITNQVYLNTRKYDIFDLINKNYAIIKASNGTYTYYFYFRVNNGEIGANGQVSYNLTLDTLQTYLFNDKLKIDGSFIVKSHLDRWIYNEDGTTVTFNGKADSKLFEREEIKEVAKRLVQRNKLKYYTENTANQELVDKFNNFACWCYVYLNDTKYCVGASNGEAIFLNFPKIKIGYSIDEDWFQGVCSVLCFPIYNKDTNTPIYVVSENGNETIKICNDGLIDFIRNNDGLSREGESNVRPDFWGNVYSIKLSVKPPVDLENIVNYKGSSYDETLNAINFTGNTTTYYLNIPYRVNGSYYNELGITTIRGSKTNSEGSNSEYNGLFLLRNDYRTPVLFKTDIEMPSLTFSKTLLKESLKNKKFNPKLNGDDYKTLRILCSGNYFEYPINKLNTENPNFEYFEPLTPEVTKGFLRFSSNDNENVFNKAYSTSYNGFSFTNDFSIAFSKSQYDSYIANNKNAYLSFENQQRLTRINTIKNSINNGIDMLTNPTSLISETRQTVNGLIDMGIQTMYAETQFNLSLDNMKSAPDSLQSLNGNAILTHLISEFGLYAELYEGLDTELEMANDIMYRDGYNYNRFDDLRSQLNIRRYFNYVKSVIGSLSGIPMSEASRIDFKQRFINGVRFWNKNEDNQFVIDYTKENYENRLNE